MNPYDFYIRECAAGGTKYILCVIVSRKPGIDWKNGAILITWCWLQYKLWVKTKRNQWIEISNTSLAVSWLKFSLKMCFCQMLPVGKTNRDENIFFPCEANRANQNAAHVVVVALLISKLMHLWWQLLELSCLPSFYLLLVSVQTLKENLYGKRSYLCSKQHLKTWTPILCMC